MRQPAFPLRAAHRVSLRPEEDDEKARDGDGECPGIEGRDVGVERFDHLKKVRRHLGNRKAKEVFDLLQTNHDCNAVREADHNGDRNELDEAAELKEPHEEQYDARPNCRKHQIGDPVLSNDAVDDDDEGTCRTADLHSAAAKK